MSLLDTKAPVKAQNTFNMQTTPQPLQKRWPTVEGGLQPKNIYHTCPKKDHTAGSVCRICVVYNGYPESTPKLFGFAER